MRATRYPLSAPVLLHFAGNSKNKPKKFTSKLISLIDTNSCASISRRSQQHRAVCSMSKLKLNFMHSAQLRRFCNFRTNETSTIFDGNRVAFAFVDAQRAKFSSTNQFCKMFTRENASSSASSSTTSTSNH